jgi:hypothetical protein
MFSPSATDPWNFAPNFAPELGPDSTDLSGGRLEQSWNAGRNAIENRLVASGLRER